MSDDSPTAITAALDRLQDTVTASFPKGWKWLQPARLIVGIATTLLVVWLNVQTSLLTQKTSELATVFEHSQENSELVRSFIDDLTEPGKANFALIALDAHVHRIDPPDANELRELNALARATIRSTVPAIKAAMARGDSREHLIKDYANTGYAFTMLMKNESPEAAKEMLAEVRADLPSSSAPSAFSKDEPPQKAHVIPDAAEQAFNSTLQRDVGASATVYVQYTTWGSSFAQAPALRSRAEDVANAVGIDRQFIVPHAAQPVSLKLVKTSVRYYYLEDKPKALLLTSIVAKQLGTPLGEPRYNGPDTPNIAPDVPRGHLEVWMATTT